MKVRYTSGNGQLVFDIEAESARELFSQLGSIQELFEAETKCGMCNSGDIRYSSRVVDEFNFYELACRECKAQFRFGQKKKGGELFPKRKNDEGEWLPNGGWARWEPRSESPSNGDGQGWSERMPPQAPAKMAANAQAGTPDGMQPSFDRLGSLFGKPAPTKLGSALDLICDQMNAIAGTAGTQKFAHVWRSYEASTGKGTTAGAKALLKDMMTALEDLKMEVHG